MRRGLVAGIVVAAAAVVALMALRGCGDDAIDESAPSSAPSAATRGTTPHVGDAPRRPRARPADDVAAGTAAPDAGAVPSVFVDGLGTLEIVLVDDTQERRPVAQSRVVVTGPDLPRGVIDRSDAAGRVTIRDLPTGHVVVCAQAPANQPLSARVVQRATFPGTATLVFHRAPRTRGRIVFEGAVDGREPPMDSIGLEFSQSPTLLEPTSPQQTVKPAADGTFEVDLVPGEWSVRRAPERGPAGVLEGFLLSAAGLTVPTTSDVVLTLCRAATFRGRIVLEPAQPAGSKGATLARIAGARVDAPGLTIGSGCAWFASEPFLAGPAEPGALYDLWVCVTTFPDLPATPRADAFAEAWKLASSVRNAVPEFWGVARGVRAGSEDVVITATPAATVRGRIVPSAGERIRVRAMLEDAGAGSHRPLVVTWTTADGEFVLAGVPRGRLLVVAGDEDAEVWSPEPVTADAGADGIEVPVVRRVLGVIRGSVAYERGAAITRGEILVQAAGPGASSSIRRAEVAYDGTFVIAKLLPGPYRLALRDLDTTLAEFGEFTAPSDGVVLTVELP